MADTAIKAARGAGDSASRNLTVVAWAIAIVSIGAVWLLHFSTEYWDRFLEWDEAVYFSQVAIGHEASEFSPHRSRLNTYLVAPVGTVTDSVAALRTYLLVITSVAYGFLFYRLRHAGIWAQAGLGLFAVALIPLYYASVLSPNLWVAILAMLRPLDAAYFMAVALLTMVAMKILRNWARISAIAVGAVGGASLWLVQTLAEHGGLQEMRDSISASVPTSFSPRFLVFLTALDGPLVTNRLTLVRPEALISGLLLCGVLWVIGTRQLERTVFDANARAFGVLAISTGAGMLLHYFFLTAVSAPRFLMATWMAISVGTAALAGGKLAKFSLWLAPVLVGVLFFTQYGVAVHVGENAAVQAERMQVLGEYLRTEVGEGGCEVATQYGAPQVMFASGCVAGSSARWNVARITESPGDRAFVVFLDDPDESLGIDMWAQVPTADGRYWSVAEIQRP